MTDLRADVQPTTLPVRLRRQLRAHLRVAVERDVVRDERAVLAHRVDRQRARCRALDKDNFPFSTLIR